MFRRLRNRLHFPRLRRDQRAIFRYWDGTRETGCDPIAALIAIEQDEEFRPDLHPQQVDDGSAEATQIMARMIERVFALPPCDPAAGHGLTITEKLALFEAFCAYVEALKKNGEPLATSPPPMDALSTAFVSATTKPSPASI